MSVGALNSALSGLKVAQQAIDVVSKNVSNVSTEGYNRKIYTQSTQVVNGEGIGVRADGVIRNVDAVLNRNHIEQLSVVSELDAKARFLQQIQDFHGPPDAEIAISNEISSLYQSFSELANEPENPFSLDVVYSGAEELARKYNDFSNYIQQVRNDAQDEMQFLIADLNSYLDQMATLNELVKTEFNLGRSTAELEDQRDQVLREISKIVAVDYYETDGKEMVVQTVRGSLLVDSTPNTVYFDPSTVGVGSYAGNGSAPIRLGDPVTGADITGEPTLGGKLGALIELRDEIMPTYSAQLDELAHKTAMRFDAVGLRLFTNGEGEIPDDTPPDYVGFAAAIEVNPAITNDKTLIQQGTEGNIVSSGSNEVLRKVVDFAFGRYAQEQSLGNIDITAAGTDPDLFTLLGIDAASEFRGDTNIQSLGALDSSQFIESLVSDTFSIQLGADPAVNIVIAPGDTATDLVNTINAADPSFAGLASLGADGELVLNSNVDITIANVNMVDLGFEALGLEVGTTPAVNPSFEVSIGNKPPVTVEILAADTQVELLAKLNAIDGIDASLDPSNFLLIEPEEGGDIKLSDGSGFPLRALGMEESKVEHAAFRFDNLGPSQTLNLGIQTGTTLLDYSQQMISLHAQEAAANDLSLENESAYEETLVTRLGNLSAVNLDEEMADLIRLQTAYNAAARAIQVIDEMFDLLTNTVAGR